MRTIAALIVTLTLLLPGEGAKAQTTLEQMMQKCETLEGFWRVNPPTPSGYTVPNQAGPAMCYGFMLAVTQLQSIIHYAGDCSKGIGPNCRRALGICFPEGVSYNQILAVFLAYARSHGAQWHYDAGGEFVIVSLGAFPCKEFKEFFEKSPSSR
jgi:hypothetical protein